MIVRDSTRETPPRTFMFQFYDNVTDLLLLLVARHRFPPLQHELGRFELSATLLIAGALLAQSAFPAIMVTGGAETAERDRVDVAYAELSQGRNEAAIARIKQNRELASDDPAAMINLGAAYARTGRERDAQRCYDRALASRERYDLELANGEWIDSRRAARKASALLRDRQTLALATRR